MNVHSWAILASVAAAAAPACRAEQSELLKELIAAHDAFRAGRWEERAKASERCRQLLLHGAPSREWSDDFKKMHALFMVEDAVCEARERCAREMSDDELDRTIAGLQRARECMLIARDKDAAAAKQLTPHFEGAVAAVGSVNHARLERSLGKMRSAAAAKNWQGCQVFVIHCRQELTRINKLDPSRTAGLAAVKLEVEHHLARANVEWRLAQAQAACDRRDWISARASSEPALSDAERLAQFDPEESEAAQARARKLHAFVLVSFVRGDLDRAEALYAETPVGAWGKWSPGSPRVHFHGDQDLESLINRFPYRLKEMPEWIPERAELVRRFQDLQARVDHWRNRPAAIGEALDLWSRTLGRAPDWADSKFDQDATSRAGTFEIAQGARRWLEGPHLAAALKLSGDWPDLAAAIEAAKHARDEGSRRWLAAVDRTLGSLESSDPETIDSQRLGFLILDVKQFTGFDGQPRALERAHALELAASSARRSRRLAPIRWAWGLFAVLLLGTVVVACFRGEPDEPPPVKEPPGTGLALLRAAVALGLFMALGQLGPLVAFGWPGQVDGQAVLRSLPSLFAISGLVGVLVGAAFQATGRMSAPPPRAGVLATLGWGLGCTVLLAVGVVGVEWLQSWLGFPVEEQDFLAEELAHPRLGLILALAFAAPLGEEVVFRRLLGTTLRDGIGRGPAFAVGALVFGASHLHLSGLVVYTVTGLCLMLAYEKTGRLWVPVAIHALNNLTACSTQGG